MALTSWKGTVVRKQDIYTAKNYLTEDEIDTLNRLTVIFLETAELRVKDRKDLTLEYWRENVDRILEFNDRKVLQNAGSISKPVMEEKVDEIYASFDKKRKIHEAEQEDLKDLEELNKKNKKKER